MTLPDEAALAASTARSRTARLAYRSSPGWRRAEDAFAGVTSAQEVASAALALFGDGGWLGEMIAPLMAALADDPWFEPPLRVHRDALRIGAVLFDHEFVSIAARVLSAGMPMPSGVVLSGRLTVMRMVAGRARLHRWSIDGRAEERIVQPGDVLVLDGRAMAHWIEPIATSAVTLTATTMLDAAPLSREIRVADGALLRTAATDERAARAQLLLSFLRVDNRHEAGDRFEAATRDPAWFLRWDAMREWLALDAGAAWPRLVEMAKEDAHAEVRAAAAATLDLLAARKAA